MPPLYLVFSCFFQFTQCCHDAVELSCVYTWPLHPFSLSNLILSSDTYCCKSLLIFFYFTSSVFHGAKTVSRGCVSPMLFLVIPCAICAVADIKRKRTLRTDLGFGGIC